MNENVSNPDVDSPKLSFRARLTEVLDKKWKLRMDSARSWFEDSFRKAEERLNEYIEEMNVLYCSSEDAIEFEFHLAVTYINGWYEIVLQLHGTDKAPIYTSDRFKVMFKNLQAGNQVEEITFRTIDQIFSGKLGVSAGAEYEDGSHSLGYLDNIFVDKVARLSYTPAQG